MLGLELKGYRACRNLSPQILEKACTTDVKRLFSFTHFISLTLKYPVIDVKLLN